MKPQTQPLCVGLTALAALTLAAPLSASAEPLVGAADQHGDLSSLEPPTLLGREIDPDNPWRGRMRRSWGGALDIYREWEAAQSATTTPVPLPSAALGGLALMGGLSGARAMRRRRDA